MVSSKISVPKNRFQVLSPVDLSALRGEPDKPEVVTDTCKVCHLQHERPVVFHEPILVDSSSSSNTEDEISDLDSMPELEDETNLDDVEIPVWLIPQGVVITFRGGQVTFEREQGPPWQEVLAQMVEEQNQTIGDN